MQIIDNNRGARRGLCSPVGLFFYGGEEINACVALPTYFCGGVLLPCPGIAPPAPPFRRHLVVVSFIVNVFI